MLKNTFPLSKYKTKSNPSKERFFSFQNIDEIVLHIDVNGTIIAEDKAGGETNADFMQKLLDKAKKQGRAVDARMLEVINQKLATRQQEAVAYIFPSFFRLIDQLEAEQVRYRVIFRTFGVDIPDIITEIKSKLPEVEFTQLDFNKPNCDAMTQRQILAAASLDNDQWVTVQENYAYWDSHGRVAQYGKQLCLNQNPRVLDVFFDDCVMCKDLIHVVDPAGATMEKTAAIAKGHLIKVDTLDAIYGDDYFIKQLMKAYARYSDSLQFAALQLLKLDV